MTYIVNENCIKCKYTDCVEVCPVDCFYEGENMLVIHPDECIDCGVCEPECPAEAILPDTEPGAEDWVEHNRKYAEEWPNITRMIQHSVDASSFEGVADKFKKPIYASYSHASNSLLFIAEQSGKIWEITDKGERNLFLDITSITHQPIFPGDERGLLGFAFSNQTDHLTLYVNFIDRNILKENFLRKTKKYSLQLVECF